LSVVLEHEFYDLRLADGARVFNSGFFTYRSDPALSQDLVAFYRGATHRFALGDQMVLNEFLHAHRPGAVNVVSDSWNMPTTGMCIESTRSLDGIRLLHYVGHKPWVNMWRPYRATTGRLVDLYELWWRYYEQTETARVLGVRHPPFWALRVAHSDAARPVWHAARRTWAGLPGRRRRGAAPQAPPSAPRPEG
jgi:lipopolysaccharide biosynthesis glycosyltransferase